MLSSTRQPLANPPQFLGTYSRSSSFMSSNAPRSTVLIWFSISCL